VRRAVGSQDRIKRLRLAENLPGLPEVRSHSSDQPGKHREDSMKAGKIPVVRVSRGGAVGTPDEFETKFEKQRSRAHERTTPAPKLPAVQNKSMQERMSQLGLEEL
jgi:hypothetical protein